MALTRRLARELTPTGATVNAIAPGFTHTDFHGDNPTRAAEKISFGAGDHRLRKRWFRPDAIQIINTGLDQVRALIGPHTKDLIRVALWGSR